MLFLIVCFLMWSCNPSTEEPDKDELALYNDTVDQLAWQCYEVCNGSHGLNAIMWATSRADSIKNVMRTQPDRRVLYYQPKIGATHKIPELAEWLTVEISSWERFFSTFSGTTPKQLLTSLTVSSALDAGQLRVDYMDIVKLDTASNTPLDSNMTVVRFSKPYFNDGRSRAVMYFESSCGPKRAKGELLMIRYKEDRWMIEERRKVWMK